MPTNSHPFCPRCGGFDLLQDSDAHASEAEPRILSCNDCGYHIARSASELPTGDPRMARLATARGQPKGSRREVVIAAQLAALLRNEVAEEAPE